MTGRTTSKRVIICLLDSFGVGAASDAAEFGDQGADTFGHLVEYCLHERGRALELPNLYQLGLYHAATESRGQCFNELALPAQAAQLDLLPGLAYGFADELSRGKDTPSGHWELMGLPVEFDWGYFPVETPSFPPALIEELVRRGQLPGVLGNCHASGTTILKTLGESHLQTGKPIVYTSADSVFQIAAHETHFGLERLYQLCDIARELVDEYQIGRVIARPFLGDSADSFYRTANRRDLATPPHGPTLLNSIQQAGGEVISVGKVADIFAHQGIDRVVKADGNDALFSATAQLLQPSVGASVNPMQLIFSNFVDFDSKYGHRRDPAGYAAALEAFDQRLPELYALMGPEDLLVVTADHGCDPTLPGSDHTRERVPLLLWGQSIQATHAIGHRKTFADLGQTLARYLGLPAVTTGESFWDDVASATIAR